MDVIDPRIHPGDSPHKSGKSLPAVAHLTRQTLAMVLAGGRGERLGALTALRAKPAVPFGGKLRIIDFALSNCVNSGIRHVCICTQYKAQSLIRHVQRGWSFLDGRFGEFIELLPAQQRIDQNWYLGTADAVFQNIDILRRHRPRFVLILAGDHVYKMDFSRMLAEHVARGAEMSIACVEVPLAEATQFGVMQVDSEFRITGFAEKPAQPAPLPGRDGAALASMGIYIFDADYLYNQLRVDAGDPASSHDFGRDIIPRLIAGGARAYAHQFANSCVNTVDGRPYWRDVGTIDAYWAANVELTHVTPELNLYDESWPIWTHQRQLPPAKFVFDDDDRRGISIDSLVSGGCIISGATVRRSVLFYAVQIHNHANVEDSVILSNTEIGAGAILKRVVVDRRCRIPDGMTIGIDIEADRARFQVSRGGVTLVTPEMLGQELYDAG
jgi:glucose-1-phosphate adenylyltransferase